MRKASRAVSSHPPRHHRPLRTALLAALACAACGAAAHHEPKPLPLNFDRSVDGWPVPEFALVDQHGDALTRSRLLGQWTFVTFGDTHDCTPACVHALRTLAALRERIGRAQVIHSTQAVFVSLDPVRDDAARLKSFLARYDDELVAATGTPPMLAALADELGARQRQERAAGYDGSLVLVGPEGTVRAVYLPPYDVRLLAADYLLKRARRR